MALLDTTQVLSLEAAEGADGPGSSEPEPFVTSINFFEANKPETHHAPLGTLWDLRLPMLTRAHGLRTPASCTYRRQRAASHRYCTCTRTSRGRATYAYRVVHHRRLPESTLLTVVRDLMSKDLSEPLSSAYGTGGFAFSRWNAALRFGSPLTAAQEGHMSLAQVGTRTTAPAPTRDTAG